jgi:hypothetical protein
MVRVCVLGESVRSAIVPCCDMDTAVPIIIGLPTIARYYPCLHDRMLHKSYTDIVSVEDKALLSI